MLAIVSAAVRISQSNHFFSTAIRIEAKDLVLILIAQPEVACLVLHRTLGKSKTFTHSCQLRIVAYQGPKRGPGRQSKYQRNNRSELLSYCSFPAVLTLSYSSLVLLAQITPQDNCSFRRIALGDRSCFTSITDRSRKHTSRPVADRDCRCWWM